MIARKELVIDNLVVSYYTSDNYSSSKGDLVFLHGWRSEGRVWYQSLQELSEDGYRVIALDLPGFGRSQTPPTDYKVADYAKLVSKFIAKLKLQEVTLLGHSFGGRLIIKLTANHPDDIKQIVLINSAGLPTATTKKRLAKILSKFFRPFFRLPFLKSLRPFIYEWLGAGDYLATPHLNKVFINTISEDLTPLLNKIKLPTLIIWGEDDLTTPLAFAKIMKQKLSQSKLVVIPSAGHFSFLDQPVKFNHTLTAWLNHE